MKDFESWIKKNNFSQNKFYKGVRIIDPSNVKAIEKYEEIEPVKDPTQLYDKYMRAR